MSDTKVIKLQVETVIHGDYGGWENENGLLDVENVQLPSQSKKQPSAFMSGLSAQMFVSGFGQMVGASGNQKLSSVVSQGSEWGFTIATALTGNPAAIATLAFKTAALAIRKIAENRQQLEELAKKFNEVEMLQMMTGQQVITANSIVSYDKYGRRTITERA